MAIGIDCSMSSVALAGFGYDSTLRRRIGPATALKRWERGYDYLKRLEDVSRPENLIHCIVADLHVFPELDQVFIAVEEPVPYGMFKTMESSAIKQQCQISGALLGGLARYGWKQLFEINNQQWRKLVADALGITTHWSSYGKGLDAKMRSKEFCLKQFPEMPDFPDLVLHSKRGLISRPEGSKAKARQPEDIYDAIPMALWMEQEILKGQA